MMLSLLMRYDGEWHSDSRRKRHGIGIRLLAVGIAISHRMPSVISIAPLLIVCINIASRNSQCVSGRRQYIEYRE